MGLGLALLTIGARLIPPGAGRGHLSPRGRPRAPLGLARLRGASHPSRRSSAGSSSSRRSSCRRRATSRVAPRPGRGARLKPAHASDSTFPGFMIPCGSNSSLMPRISGHEVTVLTLERMHLAEPDPVLAGARASACERIRHEQLDQLVRRADLIGVVRVDISERWTLPSPACPTSPAIEAAPLDLLPRERDRRRQLGERDADVGRAVAPSRAPRPPRRRRTSGGRPTAARARSGRAPRRRRSRPPTRRSPRRARGPTSPCPRSPPPRRTATRRPGSPSRGTR